MYVCLCLCLSALEFHVILQKTYIKLYLLIKSVFDGFVRVFQSFHFLFFALNDDLMDCPIYGFFEIGKTYVFFFDILFFCHGLIEFSGSKI